MTNRNLTEDERDALERLIDSTNLNVVLQGLSWICEERADHIQSNYEMEMWIDPLARKWYHAAGVIGMAATDRHVMAVSL